MKIAIVGLGYVGLPLAVAFARANHQVIAFDIDQQKINALKKGQSYIEDITDEELLEVLGLLTPTEQIADLHEAEAILICVPTPLTKHREPDLYPLRSAISEIAPLLCKGQLVVLESTTYPGTTREELLPAIEQEGFVVGQDIYLAFSPERVDPGRKDYTLKTTPKVVGGITDACTHRAQELYSEICNEVVLVSTPEAAELAKLLENTFRSVNIALMNELAMLTDRMGIDIWEVIDAASTKPYGFMRFEPGPGMGGHCLPVDPFYLAWKAREFDLSTEFVELAGKINQQMPYHCAAKAQRILNEQGIPVQNAKIAIIGVSYKANVGDIRESPALKIIEILQRGNAKVVYHDPYVDELKEFQLKSVDLHEALHAADLVVIVTAHSSLDYEEILGSPVNILDLRGVLRSMVISHSCYTTL